MPVSVSVTMCMQSSTALHALVSNDRAQLQTLVHAGDPVVAAVAGNIAIARQRSLHGCMIVRQLQVTNSGTAEAPMLAAGISHRIRL